MDGDGTGGRLHASEDGVTDPEPGDVDDGRTESDVETLTDHTSLLWVLAVALYGGGDLLTTVFGVSSGRAVETGVVAAGLVDHYGLGVVVPLKLGSFLAFYLLWRAVPNPHAVGVPLGLALTGALLTGWNSLVLLGAITSLG